MIVLPDEFIIYQWVASALFPYFLIWGFILQGKVQELRNERDQTLIDLGKQEELTKRFQGKRDSILQEKNNILLRYKALQTKYEVLEEKLDEQ